MAMVYAAAGRLTVTTTRPARPGRAVRYAHEGLGRQTSRTDALGREARTVFDPLGRPTRTVVNWQNGVAEPADGHDRDLVTATEHDAAGRRTALVTPDGRRTTFAYDGLDRLTTVVENAGGAAPPANVATRYGYDRRGLLTAITDANGHTRGRGYNAAGWQTSQTDGLGRATTWGYDRAGNRVSVADPRPVTVTHTYDALGRLTGTTAPGLTPIAHTYDVGGRRTSLADETGTTTYGYDGLDRPTSIAHSATGTVSHSWDAAGRRTGVATSAGAPAIDGAGTGRAR